MLIMQIQSVEEIAETKTANTQAFYILGKLRHWIGKHERTGSKDDKEMIKYWCEKADKLTAAKLDAVFNLEEEPGIPSTGFKSLMQQLKDGELFKK